MTLDFTRVSVQAFDTSQGVKLIAKTYTLTRGAPRRPAARNLHGAYYHSHGLALLALALASLDCAQFTRAYYNSHGLAQALKSLILIHSYPRALDTQNKIKIML